MVSQSPVSLHLGRPSDGLEDRSRLLRVLHGIGARLLEGIQRTDELRAAVVAGWRLRLTGIRLLCRGPFSGARCQHGSREEWEAESQPSRCLHAATSRTVRAAMGGWLVNRALPH
jgi:hypothetical protein